MAIVLESQSAIAHTTTSDDVTITAPSGIQEGDLLVGFYVCWPGSVSALPIASTGFTSYEEYNGSGGDRSTAFLTKIATVADESEANYTITGSNDAGTEDTAEFMCRFSGVHADILDVEYSTVSHFIADLNTISPTPQDITTVTPNAWVIVFAHHAFGNNVTDVTVPSGYTKIEDAHKDDPWTGNSNGRAFCVAYLEKTTAGLENPGSFTFTSGSSTDDNNVFTFALKPASAALPSFHGANRGIMRGVARGVG